MRFRQQKGSARAAGRFSSRLVHDSAQPRAQKIHQLRQAKLANVVAVAGASGQHAPALHALPRLPTVRRLTKLGYDFLYAAPLSWSAPFKVIHPSRKRSCDTSGIGDGF
jgi:hypothetical protein